jgi:hypothetical protein
MTRAAVDAQTQRAKGSGSQPAPPASPEGAAAPGS